MEDNAVWAGVAAGAMVLLATALILKHMYIYKIKYLLIDAY
jgi:hypothetical protein